MDDHDWLTRRFEEHRPRLRAVAQRLLGSTAEADDAVQETWIRLNRPDADRIINLEAWLVTTVGRVALNLLRSRGIRREEPLDASRADAGVGDRDDVDPAREALLADSVGLALQVVLDTLTPAERLAYVLHDMFSVPFSEIGAILDRSPESARQLASRGRRRIRGLDVVPDDMTLDDDASAQREVVEAFLAAARGGDFDALVAVLDPDVVQRTELVDGSVVEVRGARTVAARAQAFALEDEDVDVRPARVGSRVGWVSYRAGDVYTIAVLTIANGRITRMDIWMDPARMSHVRVAPYRP